MHDPGLSVQELINCKFGMNVRPCRKEKAIAGNAPKNYTSESDYDHCSQKGTRQAHSLSPCPWVMTIHCNTGVTIFFTLDDIPKQVVLPPDIRYTLASVILYNGSHY